MSNVTVILDAIQKGDPKAPEELLPLVYDELRKLAAFKLAQQSPDQTLQPTALVHEVYLRLLGHEQRSWQDRKHFFAAAAEAMRHVLVDRARRKASVRHGGGWQRLDLDDAVIAAGTSDENILLINEAWKSSPCMIQPAPTWSNCASLEDLRSPRLPRSWASPSGPPNVSGPTLGHGCIAKSRRCDGLTGRVRTLPLPFRRGEGWVRGPFVDVRTPVVCEICPPHPDPLLLLGGEGVIRMSASLMQYPRS